MKALLEPVYFVHISDTHFGPTKAYSRHGVRSYPYAQRMVEVINEMPIQPDFVIHTGDVVTNPHPDAYRLAAETFAQLNVPIYYVVGNHDTAVDVHRFLPMGPKRDLTDDPDVLSYTFHIKGHDFLVLDARGPDEIDPRGLFSEEQLAIAHRLLVEEATAPITVFMHYPCLPLNTTWMDAYMLVVNGDEAHQIFRQGREWLRGVFFGHVHQHMQVVRDGVLYVSVASTFAQFMAWPSENGMGLNPVEPPGYGFVHLLPDQTIIHQHTFERLAV